LDQFVKMTLAQRVAGEDAFKAAKAAHNPLLAFLLSDHKALSQMVATTAAAKVPQPLLIAHWSLSFASGARLFSCSAVLASQPGLFSRPVLGYSPGVVARASLGSAFAVCLPA
jgi:hypothetical protein